MGRGAAHFALNPAPARFCRACKLRVGFTFLRGWGKKINMRRENPMKFRFQHPPVRLSRHTAMPDRVCVVCGCFAPTAASSSCHRALVAAKPGTLALWSFAEAGPPRSVLRAEWPW